MATVTDNNELQHDRRRSAADLIPNSKIAQDVLKQRAKHFAKFENARNELTEQTSYVRFRLGDNEFYGIPYQYVKEVMHNVVLTKLPHTPDYIAGIINRRSSLLAIINLKYIFHTKISEHTDDNYLIIVTANNMTIGIMADGIEGSDTYETDMLSPPIASEGIHNIAYISGLHNGNTTIINIETLLSDPELLMKNS